MRIIKILVVIVLISGCREKSVPLSLLTKIDSIARNRVPDSREGICTVNLEKQKDGNFVLSGETDNIQAKKEIQAYLDKTGIVYNDSLSLLPDTMVIKKGWGLVTVSVCNIMKGSSFGSELVTQAIMGTPVKILKKRGSWLLIRTPDYYLGWVTGSSLSLLGEADLTNWKKSDRIIYLPKTGDIVTGDGNDEIVSDVVKGAIIRVKKTTDKWYAVTLPDGREGNIPVKDAVDFHKWSNSVVPDPDRMISVGKSMKGYPYLWGGTSTKGIDCSGFTKTLYFSGGIILARDASLQYQYGIPVEVTASCEYLKPGDLVFFGHLDNEGEKRITHVGMYIGDTRVIHSSGMVRINSLDPSRPDYSSYLKETVMGARRIIGAPDVRGTQSVKNHPWYF